VGRLLREYPRQTGHLGWSYFCVCDRILSCLEEDPHYTTYQVSWRSLRCYRPQILQRRLLHGNYRIEIYAWTKLNVVSAIPCVKGQRSHQIGGRSPCGPRLQSRLPKEVSSTSFASRFILSLMSRIVKQTSQPFDGATKSLVNWLVVWVSTEGNSLQGTQSSLLTARRPVKKSLPLSTSRRLILYTRTRMRRHSRRSIVTLVSLCSWWK